MKRLPNKLTHRNQRIITGGIGASLIIILVVGIVVLSQAPAIFAAAGPGNAKPSKAGCKEGTTSRYWDICYGATWRYYKWGQRSKTFVDGTTGKRRDNGPVVQTSKSGNTVGGPLSGCKKADGFFILGMEAYKRKGSGTGTKNATSLGYQVGISQVRKMTKADPAGKYNFVVVKGSKTWKEAREAFQEALGKNQTGKYKHFAGTLGWFCSDDPEKPNKPQIPSHEAQAQGDFWSWSGIKIPKQGKDIEEHEAESDINGDVTIKLSTNEPQITVDFYHKMSYGDGLWDSAHQGCKDGHDKYDNASSGWEVEYTEDASGSAGSGSYNTGGTGDNKDKEVSKTSGYTISLQPGESKKVCQVIRYNPATVPMEGEPVYKNIYNSEGQLIGRELRYYNFHVGSTSGNGDSQSCVEVTRPIIPGSDEDPNKDELPGPVVNVNSDIFFAGETANIGWKAKLSDDPGKISNYNTRRYAGYQAVVFNYGYGIDYDNGNNVKGEKTYKDGNVCHYYQSRKPGKNCVPMWEDEVDNQPTDEYFFPDPNPLDDHPDVVVPDDVGDKYCNSLGYKFEYWVGVEKNGSTTWQKEGDKTYWAVYDSKCRTIAKKPSTAIWNGSLITQGGVKASTAERYLMPIMGETYADAGSDQRTYGTWSEYLNVIGLNVKGVASGATFAIGSLNDLPEYYSPLTISNNNPDALGQSHVLRNDAYLTRLKTFLRDNQKIGAQEISDVNQIDGSKGGTQVYHISGSTTLSHDLIYPGSTYRSVYDLPQTIIFVDGNLDIAPGVSRIDAWLIVNGTLNTCKGYRNRVTEAAPGFECINQLAVNGPVIANQLITKRSFGADPTGSAAGSGIFTSSERYAPAEIFNLRQDAFLWAYAQAGRYDSSYTEVYSRELAPRY